jgi:rhodanese-related sulfurtransferase
LWQGKRLFNALPVVYSGDGRASTFEVIMKTATCALVLLFIASLSFAQDIPRDKQTKLGLYATAREAYDAWKADPGAVKLLDVRTPDEYLFVGHTEMAWLVPFKLQVYRWDESGKKLPMKNNPDFFAHAKEIIQASDRVYVMCRSGGRSAMAVNALADAGFTNVYNIVDGMEGDAEADRNSPDYGKRVKNGWKNAGLPWTYELDPSKMRLPATDAKN